MRRRQWRCALSSNDCPDSTSAVAAALLAKIVTATICRQTDGEQRQLNTGLCAHVQRQRAQEQELLVLRSSLTELVDTVGRCCAGPARGGSVPAAPLFRRRGGDASHRSQTLSSFGAPGRRSRSRSRGAHGRPPASAVIAAVNSTTCDARRERRLQARLSAEANLYRADAPSSSSSSAAAPGGGAAATVQASTSAAGSSVTAQVVQLWKEQAGGSAARIGSGTGQALDPLMVVEMRLSGRWRRSHRPSPGI
eukprot:COSAG01_NODE_4603_length_4884_cov_31.141902_4_plen_251_part_00